MNEKRRKEIGKRIKELRKECNLSQIELSNKVGKSSAAYIAFIESGERNITSMDMIILAKELGATVGELVGEESVGKTISFKQALRNTGDLDPNDKKRIRDFYDYLQNSKNKRG